MQLAKFKFVALFVVAVSLAGGAGLFAGKGTMPVAASDPPQHAAAGPEAQKKKPPAHVVAKPPQWPQANTWQIDWAQDQQEANHLERQIEEAEEEWAKETEAAQAAVLQKQEALQELADNHVAKEREQKAQEQLARQRLFQARQELNQIETIAAGQSGDARARTEKHVERATVDLEAVHMRAAEERQHYGQARLKAQVALLAARDRVQRIERRQARKRAQLEADLDTIQQRIRQARFGLPPGMSLKNDRLERKVDQLHQDIEQLRKDLLRTPSKR